MRAWDSEEQRLVFSPLGSHPPLRVPVHRIVALSGDEQRRRRHEFPAHEPYEGEDAEYGS
ncbi:hypothetical protein ACWEPM_38165 [Streptomyces sp. NPDC004244]